MKSKSQINNKDKDFAKKEEKRGYDSMMITLTIFEKYGITEDSIGRKALLDLSTEIILTLRHKTIEGFFEDLMGGDDAHNLQIQKA